MVKAHVVSHQHSALEQREQCSRDLVKTGCIGQHGIADASEALNVWRNRPAWMNQCAPARHLLALLDAHRGDFSDAVAHWVTASGLQVEHQVAGQHGLQAASRCHSG